MTLSASHYAQEDSTSVSSDVKLEKLDPSNHNGLVLCKADAPIKGKEIADVGAQNPSQSEVTASCNGRRVKTELSDSDNEQAIKADYSDEEWEGFSDSDSPEQVATSTPKSLESEVVATNPSSIQKSGTLSTDQPKPLKSEVLVTGPAPVLDAALPGFVPAIKHQVPAPAPVERKPRTDDQGTSRQPGHNGGNGNKNVPKHSPAFLTARKVQRKEGKKRHKTLQRQINAAIQHDPNWDPFGPASFNR